MIDAKLKTKSIPIKYKINVFWTLKKKCFKLFKKKIPVDAYQRGKFNIMM